MLTEIAGKTISESLFSEKVYWLNQLSGELPESTLITDYKRPRTYSKKNKTVQFQLDEAVSQRILKLSNGSPNSVYLFLVATAQILLEKYTNNSDLIVGIPAFDNGADIKTLANSILPLRTCINNNLTFKDVLLQVKERVIDAYVHQSYPINTIAQLLELPQHHNRCSIFDVVILLENIHAYDEISDLNNDLTISFAIEDQGIRGTIDYSDLLFFDGTIDAIANYYTNILKSVVQQPSLQLSDITLLTVSDQHHLLEDFNDSYGLYPVEKTISDLFEKQVVQTPDNIAVVDAVGKLSYQDLNNKANQLARFLRQVGLVPGEFVGIYKHRDINFLIAILAIHKAGGAYVPIDSSYPLDRIQYMLANSAVRFLLTDGLCVKPLDDFVEPCLELEHVICLDTVADFKQTGLAHAKVYDSQDFQTLSQENLEQRNQGTAPAYMLYTSGSTGLPKGAIIRHDGAVNHIYAQLDALALHDNFSFLQSAPASSDISVWQFLGPLLTGGKTVIVDTETVCDPAKLFQII
ncbi:MAG: AMP-binding protein, partial [Cyanobacteria bacterium P01_H01_bin.21]